MTAKTHPETRYWGKRVTEGPWLVMEVYKQLLPDGESTELSPDPSLKLRDHSPDGFQWGYGGAGPAQLALALLLDVTTSPDMAQAYYQDFKFDVVAAWGEEWEITSQEILDWLGREETRELHKSVMSSRN